MICSACPASQDVGPGDAAADDDCPACGGPMVYADPAAAASAVAREAVGPRRRVSAWRVVRRELLIGLAWGVGLAVLVGSPQCMRPAFRGPDGRVSAYTPTIGWDAVGGRVYRPGTAPLGRGESALRVAETSGVIVGTAVGIGALVGMSKLPRRRRRDAEPDRRVAG